MPTPTIIVIDDDPLNYRMITELLINEGYHVADDVTSTSLIIDSTQQMPALLILDLHIAYPTSGWEILSQIRRRSATRTLPVILLTDDARFERRYHTHIQALGAIVLEKPFLVEDLLNTVAWAVDRWKPVVTKRRIQNSPLMRYSTKL